VPCRWGESWLPVAVVVAIVVGMTAVDGPPPVQASGYASRRSRPRHRWAGDGPIMTEADPFTTDAPGLAPGQIEMTTLSTRPTPVTGPQVRVAVRGLQSDDWLTVTSNGIDVSGAFAPK
jgi:hypothetical protein